MSDDEGEGPGSAPRRPDCLCHGLGPEITKLLRQLAPTEETWRHLRSAEVDVLTVLRGLLDDRIRAITREGERGMKVTIE
jgi:acetylglutamate kinase